MAGRPEPMLFRSRVFHVAKDADYANEYEDAFYVDEARSVAAIADGVSSAVFSAKWARILTQSIVENPPELARNDSFGPWLAQQRSEWMGQIDFANLPYNLKTKLRQAGGAFSTLLWVEVVRTADEEKDEQFQFHAYALGDSCLVHVRGGDVLATFPLKSAAEFEADPITICSVNLKCDETLQFREIEGACEPGDLLVLCTDALAKWAITRLENGAQVHWGSYWTMDEAFWFEEIAALRDAHEMRRDDTTLVLLRIGDSPLVTEPSLEGTSPVAFTEEKADPLQPGVSDEDVSTQTAASFALAPGEPTATEEECACRSEEVVCTRSRTVAGTEAQTGSALDEGRMPSTATTIAEGSATDSGPPLVEPHQAANVATTGAGRAIAPYEDTLPAEERRAIG